MDIDRGNQRNMHTPVEQLTSAATPAGSPSTPCGQLMSTTSRIPSSGGGPCPSDFTPPQPIRTPIYTRESSSSGHGGGMSATSFAAKNHSGSSRGSVRIGTKTPSPIPVHDPACAATSVIASPAYCGSPSPLRGVSRVQDFSPAPPKARLGVNPSVGPGAVQIPSSGLLPRLSQSDPLLRNVWGPSGAANTSNSALVLPGAGTARQGGEGDQEEDEDDTVRHPTAVPAPGSVQSHIDPVAPLVVAATPNATAAGPSPRVAASAAAKAEEHAISVAAGRFGGRGGGGRGSSTLRVTSPDSPHRAIALQSHPAEIPAALYVSPRQGPAKPHTTAPDPKMSPVPISDTKSVDAMAAAISPPRIEIARLDAPARLADVVAATEHCDMEGRAGCRQEAQTPCSDELQSPLMQMRRTSTDHPYGRGSRGRHVNPTSMERAAVENDHGRTNQSDARPVCDEDATSEHEIEVVPAPQTAARDSTRPRYHKAPKCVRGHAPTEATTAAADRLSQRELSQLEDVAAAAKMSQCPGDDEDALPASLDVLSVEGGAAGSQDLFVVPRHSRFQSAEGPALPRRASFVSEPVALTRTTTLDVADVNDADAPPDARHAEHPDIMGGEIFAPVIPLPRAASSLLGRRGTPLSIGEASMSANNSPPPQSTFDDEEATFGPKQPISPIAGAPIGAVLRQGHPIRGVTPPSSSVAGAGVGAGVGVSGAPPRQDSAVHMHVTSPLGHPPSFSASIAGSSVSAFRRSTPAAVGPAIASPHGSAPVQPVAMQGLLSCGASSAVTAGSGGGQAMLMENQPSTILASSPRLSQLSSRPSSQQSPPNGQRAVSSSFTSPHDGVGQYGNDDDGADNEDRPGPSVRPTKAGSTSGTCSTAGSAQQLFKPEHTSNKEAPIIDFGNPMIAIQPAEAAGPAVPLVSLQEDSFGAAGMSVHSNSGGLAVPLHARQATREGPATTDANPSSSAFGDFHTRLPSGAAYPSRESQGTYPRPTSNLRPMAADPKSSVGREYLSAGRSGAGSWTRDSVTPLHSAAVSPQRTQRILSAGAAMASHRHSSARYRSGGGGGGHHRQHSGGLTPRNAPNRNPFSPHRATNADTSGIVSGHKAIVVFEQTFRAAGTSPQLSRSASPRAAKFSSFSPPPQSEVDLMSDPRSRSHATNPGVMSFDASVTSLPGGRAAYVPADRHGRNGINLDTRSSVGSRTPLAMPLTGIPLPTALSHGDDDDPITDNTGVATPRQLPSWCALKQEGNTSANYGQISTNGDSSRLDRLDTSESRETPSQSFRSVSPGASAQGSVKRPRHSASGLAHQFPSCLSTRRSGDTSLDALSTPPRSSPQNMPRPASGAGDADATRSLQFGGVGDTSEDTVVVNSTAVSSPGLFGTTSDQAGTPKRQVFGAIDEDDDVSPQSAPRLLARVPSVAGGSATSPQRSGLFPCDLNDSTSMPPPMPMPMPATPAKSKRRDRRRLSEGHHHHSSHVRQQSQSQSETETMLRCQRMVEDQGVSPGRTFGRPAVSVNDVMSTPVQNNDEPSTPTGAVAMTRDDVTTPVRGTPDQAALATPARGGGFCSGFGGGLDALESPARGGDGRYCGIALLSPARSAQRRPGTPVSQSPAMGAAGGLYGHIDVSVSPQKKGRRRSSIFDEDSMPHFGGCGANSSSPSRGLLSAGSAGGGGGVSSGSTLFGVSDSAKKMHSGSGLFADTDYSAGVGLFDDRHPMPHETSHGGDAPPTNFDRGCADQASGCRLFAGGSDEDDAREYTVQKKPKRRSKKHTRDGSAGCDSSFGMTPPVGTDVTPARRGIAERYRNATIPRYKPRFHWRHPIPWLEEQDPRGEFVPLHHDVNGTVWLATAMSDGLPYAVKEVPFSSVLDDVNITDFKAMAADPVVADEIKASLLSTECDALWRYHTTRHDPIRGVHVLQFEYCCQGTLVEHVLHPVTQEVPKTSDGTEAEHQLQMYGHVQAPEVREVFVIPSEALITRVLRDGCRALACLHSHGIAHGNAQPRNVYVTGSDSFRLGNFGAAIGPSAADGDGKLYWHRFYALPDLYEPPEKPPGAAADYVNKETPFTRDVYSFGLGLLHLIGIAEWQETTQSAANVVEAIARRRVPSVELLMDLGMSRELIETIAMMTEQDSTKRITAQGVVDRVGAPTGIEAAVIAAYESEIATLKAAIVAKRAAKEREAEEEAQRQRQQEAFEQLQRRAMVSAPAAAHHGAAPSHHVGQAPLPAFSSSSGPMFNGEGTVGPSAQSQFGYSGGGATDELVQLPLFSLQDFMASRSMPPGQLAPASTRHQSTTSPGFSPSQQALSMTAQPETQLPTGNGPLDGLSSAPQSMTLHDEEFHRCMALSMRSGAVSREGRATAVGRGESPCMGLPTFTDDARSAAGRSVVTPFDPARSPAQASLATAAFYHQSLAGDGVTSTNVSFARSTQAGGGDSFASRPPGLAGMGTGMYGGGMSSTSYSQPQTPSLAMAQQPTACFLASPTTCASTAGGDQSRALSEATMSPQPSRDHHVRHAGSVAKSSSTDDENAMLRCDTQCPEPIVQSLFPSDGSTHGGLPLPAFGLEPSAAPQGIMAGLPLPFSHNSERSTPIPPFDGTPVTPFFEAQSTEHLHTPERPFPLMLPASRRSGRTMTTDEEMTPGAAPPCRARAPTMMGANLGLSTFGGSSGGFGGGAPALGSGGFTSSAGTFTSGVQSGLFSPSKESAAGTPAGATAASTSTLPLSTTMAGQQPGANRRASTPQYQQQATPNLPPTRGGRPPSRGSVVSLQLPASSGPSPSSVAAAERGPGWERHAWRTSSPLNAHHPSSAQLSIDTPNPQSHSAAFSSLPGSPVIGLGRKGSFCAASPTLAGGIQALSHSRWAHSLGSQAPASLPPSSVHTDRSGQLASATPLVGGPSAAGPASDHPNTAESAPTFSHSESAVTLDGSPPPTGATVTPFFQAAGPAGEPVRQSRHVPHHQGLATPEHQRGQAGQTSSQQTSSDASPAIARHTQYGRRKPFQRSPEYQVPFAPSTSGPSSIGQASSSSPGSGECPTAMPCQSTPGPLMAGAAGAFNITGAIASRRLSSVRPAPVMLCDPLSPEQTQDTTVDTTPDRDDDAEVPSASATSGVEEKVDGVDGALPFLPSPPLAPAAAPPQDAKAVARAAPVPEPPKLRDRARSVHGTAGLSGLSAAALAGPGSPVLTIPRHPHVMAASPLGPSQRNSPMSASFPSPSALGLSVGATTIGGSSGRTGGELDPASGRNTATNPQSSHASPALASLTARGLYHSSHEMQTPQYHGNGSFGSSFAGAQCALPASAHDAAGDGSDPAASVATPYSAMPGREPSFGRGVSGGNPADRSPLSSSTWSLHRTPTAHRNAAVARTPSPVNNPTLPPFLQPPEAGSGGVGPSVPSNGASVEPVPPIIVPSECSSSAPAASSSGGLPPHAPHAPLLPSLTSPLKEGRRLMTPSPNTGSHGQYPTVLMEWSATSTPIRPKGTATPSGAPQSINSLRRPQPQSAVAATAAGAPALTPLSFTAGSVRTPCGLPTSPSLAGAMTSSGHRHRSASRHFGAAAPGSGLNGGSGGTPSASAPDMLELGSGWIQAEAAAQSNHPLQESFPNAQLSMSVLEEVRRWDGSGPEAGLGASARGRSGSFVLGSSLRGRRSAGTPSEGQDTAARSARQLSTTEKKSIQRRRGGSGASQSQAAPELAEVDGNNPTQSQLPSSSSLAHPQARSVAEDVTVDNGDDEADSALPLRPAEESSMAERTLQSFSLSPETLREEAERRTEHGMETPLATAGVDTVSPDGVNFQALTVDSAPPSGGSGKATVGTAEHASSSNGGSAEKKATVSTPGSNAQLTTSPKTATTTTVSAMRGSTNSRSVDANSHSVVTACAQLHHVRGTPSSGVPMSTQDDDDDDDAAVRMEMDLVQIGSNAEDQANDEDATMSPVFTDGTQQSPSGGTTRSALTSTARSRKAGPASVGDEDGMLSNDRTVSGITGVSSLTLRRSRLDDDDEDATSAVLSSEDRARLAVLVGSDASSEIRRLDGMDLLSVPRDRQAGLLHAVEQQLLFTETKSEGANESAERTRMAQLAGSCDNARTSLRRLPETNNAENSGVVDPDDTVPAMAAAAPGGPCPFAAGLGDGSDERHAVRTVPLGKPLSLSPGEPAASNGPMKGGNENEIGCGEKKTLGRALFADDDDDEDAETQTASDGKVQLFSSNSRFCQQKQGLPKEFSFHPDLGVVVQRHVDVANDADVTIRARIDAAGDVTLRKPQLPVTKTDEELLKMSGRNDVSTPVADGCSTPVSPQPMAGHRDFMAACQSPAIIRSPAKGKRPKSGKHRRGDAQSSGVAQALFDDSDGEDFGLPGLGQQPSPARFQVPTESPAKGQRPSGPRGSSGGVGQALFGDSDRDEDNAAPRSPERPLFGAQGAMPPCMSPQGVAQSPVKARRPKSSSSRAAGSSKKSKAAVAHALFQTDSDDEDAMNAAAVSRGARIQLPVGHAQDISQCGLSSGSVSGGTFGDTFGGGGSLPVVSGSSLPLGSTAGSFDPRPVSVHAGVGDSSATHRVSASQRTSGLLPALSAAPQPRAARGLTYGDDTTPLRDELPLSLGVSPQRSPALSFAAPPGSQQHHHSAMSPPNMQQHSGSGGPSVTTSPGCSGPSSGFGASVADAVSWPCLDGASAVAHQAHGGAMRAGCLTPPRGAGAAGLAVSLLSPTAQGGGAAVTPEQRLERQRQRALDFVAKISTCAASEAVAANADEAVEILRLRLRNVARYGRPMMCDDSDDDADDGCADGLHF